jgi:hypothetical protein
MNKVVLLQSVSKQYLAVKTAVRRNARLVSQLKLWLVSTLLLIVIIVYAHQVNESSTQWWFLKQDMAVLDELMFDHSSIKLDVILREKSLREEVSSQNVSWAAMHTERITTLSTYWDGLEE